jgi:hypothetical protein
MRQLKLRTAKEFVSAAVSMFLMAPPAMGNSVLSDAGASDSRLASSSRSPAGPQAFIGRAIQIIDLAQRNNACKTDVCLNPLVRLEQTVKRWTAAADTRRKSELSDSAMKTELRERLVALRAGIILENPGIEAELAAKKREIASTLFRAYNNNKNNDNISSPLGQLASLDPLKLALAGQPRFFSLNSQIPGGPGLPSPIVQSTEEACDSDTSPCGCGSQYSPCCANRCNYWDDCVTPCTLLACNYLIQLLCAIGCGISVLSCIEACYTWVPEC